MTDVHTRKQRSRNMAAIRGKNTKPEMFVRRMLHGFGFRYILHGKGLPGKPDLVFPSRRKVIFVHGCYWHMHDCKWGNVIEATRTEFWQSKRRGNVVRDIKNTTLLLEEGWEVSVVWECETKDPESLALRLVMFLSSTQSDGPREVIRAARSVHPSFALSLKKSSAARRTVRRRRGRLI